MSFRPVVFDCDGTLTDSETLGWEAMGEVLRRYGVEMTPADREVLAGASYAEDHAYFARRAPLPDADRFWEELAEEMFRRFDEQLQAFEDAIDTLEVLAARGISLAVASNSPAPRLERTLAATGLSRFFSVAVSADEVVRPKPAPDVFLRAASLLGVEPEDCVVVEDTRTGVQAAQAAGMLAVLVDRDGVAGDGLGADVVIPRLTPAAVMLPMPR